MHVNRLYYQYCVLTVLVAKRIWLGLSFRTVFHLIELRGGFWNSSQTANEGAI